MTERLGTMAKQGGEISIHKIRGGKFSTKEKLQVNFWNVPWEYQGEIYAQTFLATLWATGPNPRGLVPYWTPKGKSLPMRYTSPN